MSGSSWKYIHILREIITNKKRDGGAIAIRGLVDKIFKWSLISIGIFGVLSIAGISIGKYFESYDDQDDRGAIAVLESAFNDSYAKPKYIDQGWKPSDSLWFYNTTQGSGLLPYDFFLALEEADSQSCNQDGLKGCLRSVKNMDHFRYLPQGASEFNPDALPVGFAKDGYQGKDYMGFTCAACHTGQVNYNGQALRIDGAPAMSNMVGFLHALDKAMEKTLTNNAKQERFVEAVLALDNDYDTKNEVREGLIRWAGSVRLYNTINHTEARSKYGYARLDAFGRIYNRVLQHIINRDQMADILSSVVGPTDKRIISDVQIGNVLAGIDKVILGDSDFTKVFDNLQSSGTGMPALNQRDMLRVRNKIFNEPNAPVSYPFLWDIAQSDYVQWNGLANNAGLGPIGRNAGEVIGVFGILDWKETGPGISLSKYLATKLSGQSRKKKQIEFTSSINLHNLGRLESRLHSLMSPKWVDAEKKLRENGVDTRYWKIDADMQDRGRLIYEQYCQSCHVIIDRTSVDRLMVAKMSSIEAVGTDPTMAKNSVGYNGQSGNFTETIQTVDVGPLVVEQTAPVVQILTSATTGVVATPDADKWKIWGFAEWIYTLITSYKDNKIEKSNKAGNYNSDTTSNPYNSLLSYKGRSLNGIWATAPYLHNGSVPTLYDLLLPSEKQEGDLETQKYRLPKFMVGSREFDPEKVGFKTDFGGFEFNTAMTPNKNSGHEYAAGRTKQMDGTLLPALTEQQRMDLLEFLKTL